MAKKPIITIDVDDSKFKSFIEQFAKYQENLDKMPDSWKGANAIMNSGMAALVEQTHSISKHLNEATHAQKQFAHTTKQGESALKGMTHQARKLSDAILGVGGALLKIGGIGLGSIGAAVFGMDRLGTDAVNTQYSARGLGISTGQKRAFSIAYKRIMPESVLSAIAAERNTPEGLAMLAVQTGLPISKLQGQNAAQIAPEVAESLRRRSARWTPEQRGVLMEAYGYTASGFDTEEARRLRRTHLEAFRKAGSQYARMSQVDETNAAQTRKMWSFVQALEQAGASIKVDLINRLSALGPVLRRNITDLAADTIKFINGALSPANIKAMRVGLEKFAHFMESGKVENAVESVAHSLMRLTRSIAGVASKIDNFVFGKKHHAPGWETWAQNVLQKTDAKVGDLFQAKMWLGGSALKAWQYATQSDFKRPLVQSMKNMQHYLPTIDAAANYYHVSPLLLEAIGATESSGDPRAFSKKGAMGLYQFEPATAKEYGLKNPYDPTSSIYAAARLLHHRMSALAKRYPNLPQGAINALTVASYNEGRGSVEHQYAKYGDTWFAKAPKETQRYVPEVQKGIYLAQQQQVGLLRQIARNTMPAPATTQHHSASRSVVKSANAAAAY